MSKKKRKQQVDNRSCFVLSYSFCHQTKWFTGYKIVTTHKPVYVVFRTSVPLPSLYGTPVPIPTEASDCRSFWVNRGAKLVMLPVGADATADELRRFKASIENMNKLIQATKDAATQRSNQFQSQDGKNRTMVTGIVETEVTETKTTWKINTTHGEFFAVFDTGTPVPFSVGDTLPSPRREQSRAELDAFLDEHAVWTTRYPQATTANPVPCEKAEQTYDNVRVREVNTCYGGLYQMTQVVTDSGHVVYFRAPSLGDADSYLSLCECDDIIPHPNDKQVTFKFWQAKGALDIATGVMTSTCKEAIASSKAIRMATMRQYERIYRRQQRYAERKKVKAAKEDATDRVLGELLPVTVQVSQPIRIHGWQEQPTAAKSGTTEYLVFTDRGDHVVVFSADEAFPFVAGDKVDTLANETVEHFWQSHGAITAHVHISDPSGNTNPTVAELKPDAIQINAWRGCNVVEEVGTKEYLVCTSRGDHLVAFPFSADFPFREKDIVASPRTEAPLDFWKRYGALSVRAYVSDDPVMQNTICITSYPQRLASPINQTGYLVFTNQGNHLVTFPAHVAFPFLVGAVVTSPPDEPVNAFWKRYGAISARVYTGMTEVTAEMGLKASEKPLTKSAVDELSVQQGTAIDSIDGDPGRNIIQIISYEKIGRPETEKVEYLVVTSLGDHIVTFHPNKQFPFSAGAVVMTPMSEGIPDFWQRYGAISMRYKVDAHK